ncbi:MAG: hypothetical protein ACK4NW_10005, partial [Roseinatronobacter sp.]
MERRVITLPALLASEVDWDIDWREQSSGTNLAGRNNIEITAMPRWIGTPKLQMHRGEINVWRAHRWFGRGQTGIFRVQMTDSGSLSKPATAQVPWDGDAFFDDGAGFADLPFVRCVGGAPAGADEIVIDELTAPHPVRAGGIMSYDELPFAVSWRLPVGGTLVRLGIEMPLRRPIPADGLIDMAAFGLFEMVDPRTGNAPYRSSRFSE